MLVAPTPFPDEGAHGYLGRVMRLNGISNAKEIDSLMRAWAGLPGSDWRETPSVELLSKIAGQEVTEFVVGHTSVPLRHGVTSYHRDLRHGSGSNRGILWSTAMRQARDGAYFCERCASEDVEFHGQSYWRREHQNPGIFWCQKHRKALRYLEEGTAFFRPPSAFLASAKYVSQEWVKELIDNPVASRYAMVCSALMERDMPLDVRVVSDALRKRARTRGYKIDGGAAKYSLLSDFAICQVDRSWLTTVLPVMANKQERTVSFQLDEAIYLRNSPTSTVTYALACALLYDSADEALNDLSGQSGQEIVFGRNRKIDVPSEDLLEAYIQCRGSYKEAAERFDCAYMTLVSRYGALGLPNLVSGGRNFLDAAVYFYVEKRPYSESLELGDVSPMEMDSLVRSAGVNFEQVLLRIDWPAIRASKPCHPRPQPGGRAIGGRDYAC